MVWAIVIFILLGILFYPFTLWLRAGSDGLRLFWLPRLFLGYGRAIPLPYQSLIKRMKRKRRDFRRSWQ